MYAVHRMFMWSMCIVWVYWKMYGVCVWSKWCVMYLLCVFCVVYVLWVCVYNVHVGICVWIMWCMRCIVYGMHVWGMRVLCVFCSLRWLDMCGACVWYVSCALYRYVWSMLWECVLCMWKFHWRCGGPTKSLMAVACVDPVSVEKRYYGMHRRRSRESILSQPCANKDDDGHGARTHRTVPGHQSK